MKTVHWWVNVNATGTACQLDTYVKMHFAVIADRWYIIKLYIKYIKLHSTGRTTDIRANQSLNMKDIMVQFWIPSQVSHLMLKV